MIYTNAMIEFEVSQISGTYIKRQNLRKKLTNKNNDYINTQIDICKGKIRDLRAMGSKESDLRHWYSEVTQFELRLL